ncbi:MAG: phosphatidate cytidylyltransferase [Leptospiraceae bacterium]|nr:phosphatidate cytidylyltransferase [Leptospiraceae bacterium]
MNETAKRIVSGVGIGAVVIFALSYDVYGWIFPFCLVAVFALLGLYEFQVLTDRGLDGSAFRKTAFVFSVLILLAFYARFLTIKDPEALHQSELHVLLRTWFYPAATNLVPLLMIALLVASSALQILSRPLDGAIYSISVTVSGVFYTTIGVGYALLLYALPAGLFYLILFALIPISSDTGAYFAGRWFGRHNAGLKVSPRKTWEGYIGGVVLSVLVVNGFLYGWTEYARSQDWPLPNIAMLEISLLGVIMSFVSVIGDLAESAFKRDAKIKDSAQTIPGHGGILDLADALFFAFPVGYFYLVLRQVAGFTLV